MSGGFVLIVGPSGAGKDTLIGLARTELGSDERFEFTRRVVTRSKSVTEDHDSIDQDGFERALTAGRFCLSWRAHGLCYGIPKAAAEKASAGRVVIANVSRTVIADARRRFPRVLVVEITAPVEVLTERLAARAREGDGSYEERIRRSEEIPDVQADLVIENAASQQEGAAKVVAFMRWVADARPSALDRQDRTGRRAAVL